MNETDEEIQVNIQCPIDKVLDLLRVRRQPGAKAWQVQCPFHKLAVGADGKVRGTERKWSARSYADSNKLWCFTEDRMYTVIEVISQITGLDTKGAVSWAKSRFTIDMDRALPEERKQDPVVEGLENSLKKGRSRVDLREYRKAAYALSTLRAVRYEPEEKKKIVGKIREKLKGMGL